MKRMKRFAGDPSKILKDGGRPFPSWVYNQKDPKVLARRAYNLFTETMSWEVLIDINQ